MKKLRASDRIPNHHPTGAKTNRLNLSYKKSCPLVGQLGFHNGVMIRIPPIDCSTMLLYNPNNSGFFHGSLGINNNEGDQRLFKKNIQTTLCSSPPSPVLLLPPMRFMAMAIARWASLAAEGGGGFWGRKAIGIRKSRLSMEVSCQLGKNIASYWLVERDSHKELPHLY